MVPAPLLRAAAVALVVAAALSAAPLDRTTAQPVPNEAKPVRNEAERVRNKEEALWEDDANHHFSMGSGARLFPRSSFVSGSRSARDRLSGWPITVLEKVRDFLQAGHAWQPNAVAALRAEAFAMRHLVSEAIAQIRTQIATSETFPAGWDWETAPSVNEHFPGAEIWPGALTWPVPKFWPDGGWPGGFAEDVWQLSGLEFLYDGVLKVEAVESDGQGPTPYPIGLEGLTKLGAQLWGRRKSRLDQLALRRDGDFGELLSAATAATCDALIKMDAADVRKANDWVIMHTNFAGYSEAPELQVLRKFISDDSAVLFFEDTRRRLSEVG